MTDKDYRELKDAKAVPVVFCNRQKIWLPVEEHMKCDHCAGVVFDEDGDPVSFLCTHDGERREFQDEDWASHSEEGYGPPSHPQKHPLEEDEES